MKAVIMAGGEGSRLRPLTCDLPKPMARLCGRPVIEYILDLLGRHGVTEASVTLGYLPGQISGYFPDGRYGNISLRFVTEETPLGTAGGVRHALAGDEDCVLVISGDALCDVNLSAAVEQHRRTGADATIVVTRVADPREYGLVTYDADGCVTGFMEKPGWNQASTDAANTGIYLVGAGALDLIPADRPFDFAGDLFPLMLSRGRKICAYETDRYWCDIGDLSTYLSCQADILRGAVETGFSDRAAQMERPAGDYTVHEPVYFGKGVTVGEGAVIGPDAVLDDGAVIGRHARVRGSAVLADAYIGDRAKLTGAVVCAGASVKGGAALFEGSVLGAGAQAGARSEILPGVRVWPGKRIEDGARLRENLQFGTARPDFFDDDGITGEAGVELTPEFCARVGAALGSLKCGARIGVGGDGTRAAKAFKAALCAGVLSTGAQVWDFGEVLESQMAFAVGFCGLAAAAYLSAGPVCGIKLVGLGGLPAARPLERELEGHLARGEFKRCDWSSYRDAADMSGMRLLYQQELYRCAPQGLGGMSAQVRCPNREGERLFEDTLRRLGCDVSGGIVMSLSPDGTRLSLTDQNAGYLAPEKVLTLCCLLNLERGRDLIVPFDAPRAVDVMAQQYGRRVVRYVGSPCDRADEDVRRASMGQLWMRDGMMAGIHILAHLRETGLSLAQVAARLPDFAMVSRSFEIDLPPGKVLEQLGAQAQRAAEGVTLTRGLGTLHIRPSKRGKSLRVLAEADSVEAAEELCAELGGLLASGVDRTDKSE